ncbi:MAG: ribulose-phosphate 3-epimerase [Caldilineaceae bacterium]
MPNPPNSIKLAPSILTADFGHLAQQLQAAEAGGADYMHLDVMDGRFVPNISFGPLLVQAVRQYTALPLDVHLMIVEPDQYIPEFAKAGAAILTVHVEACVHLHRTLQLIRDVGCRASVALNPATPVEAVYEVLPLLDMVLVMSVNPGFGGQQFIAQSLDKLQRMRRLINERNPACDLEVDGGVGAHNIADVAASGANVIVAGSAIYNAKASVAENLRTLRAALM